MELWLAAIVLIIGMGILYLSSELAVDRLILLASKLGASMFTVGFVVSSIGSDLPEIVNSIISSYLGHGNISVGDSLGSVNTQITLVRGINSLLLYILQTHTPRICHRRNIRSGNRGYLGIPLSRWSGHKN